MSFKPMLAHKFYDSTDSPKKPTDFLFKGSAGSLNKDGIWTFNRKVTRYKLNPTGWYISEKRDGVRAVWLPKKGEFIFRSGKKIHAPEWFISKMPKTCALDGELFGGRNTFNVLSGIVRRKRGDRNAWNQVTFEVFDILQNTLKCQSFERRQEILKDVVTRMNFKNLVYVKQIRVKSMQHAHYLYRNWLQKGAEGAMLRKPGSLYENKRSYTLLKWKPIPTEEALIIGYNEGTGKLKGKLGTFKVRQITGALKHTRKVFNLSGRMSANFRNQYKLDHNHKLMKPPKNTNKYPVIGSVVSFEFMSYSSNGTPRQPIYIGTRHVDNM